MKLAIVFLFAAIFAVATAQPLIIRKIVDAFKEHEAITLPMKAVKEVHENLTDPDKEPLTLLGKMAKKGLEDLHDPDHKPKTIPGAMIKAAHAKLHDEDFEPMTIAGSLVKMAHAEFDNLMEPKNSNHHH